jgi:hypothetical protein
MDRMILQWQVKFIHVMKWFAAVLTRERWKYYRQSHLLKSNTEIGCKIPLWYEN